MMLHLAAERDMQIGNGPGMACHSQAGASWAGVLGRVKSLARPGQQPYGRS